jgi:predicted Abi (CAAX) family protease
VPITQEDRTVTAGQAPDGGSRETVHRIPDQRSLASVVLAMNARSWLFVVNAVLIGAMVMNAVIMSARS